MFVLINKTTKMERKTGISISLLAILILLGIAGYIISNDSIGDGIKVIDGDTFIYEGKTIRLLCVDTPEKGQNGYKSATKYLSDIISNQQLTLEEEGLDKYNRTLAWVYTQDNIFVNQKVKEQDYGKIFVYEDTNCDRLKT